MKKRYSKDDGPGNRAEWLREKQAFYDRISGIYNAMSGHYEHKSRDAGIAMLDPREGERVLEIGSGTGQSLVSMAASVGKGGRVLGLDVSMGMLRQSMGQMRSAGVVAQTELILGDALNLPCRDECVDGVFMSFTLELFPEEEVEPVLSECRRVLRKGGRLVVVALSKARAHSVVVSLYQWLHEKFPHFMDCQPILVRGALESAGFQIQEQEFSKVWKLPVEIVLGRKT